MDTPTRAGKREAVTLVEFDNRITGQRWSEIITAPRARAVRSLGKCYVEIDPETGQPVPIELQTLDRGPIDACVFVAPKGAIRVLIYPTEEPEGTELPIEELDDSFPLERFRR